MKQNKIIFLTITTLFLVVYSCKSSQPVKDMSSATCDLIGSWHGQYKETTAVINFESATNMTMTFDSPVARTFTGTYSVDCSVQPAHIDMNMPDHGLVKTIFRTTDTDTLIMQNNAPGVERPKNFETISTITYKRLK